MAFADLIKGYEEIGIGDHDVFLRYPLEASDMETLTLAQAEFAAESKKDGGNLKVASIQRIYVAAVQVCVRDMETLDDPSPRLSEIEAKRMMARARIEESVDGTIKTTLAKRCMTLCGLEAADESLGKALAQSVSKTDD